MSPSRSGSFVVVSALDALNRLEPEDSTGGAPITGQGGTTSIANTVRFAHRLNNFELQQILASLALPAKNACIWRATWRIQPM
jgi:hypothetical protein